MSLPDLAVPGTPPSSPIIGANAGPNRTTNANRSSSLPSSLLRPPSRRGSDSIMPADPRQSPAKPPIFGSTSLKQGMDEAMAKLNLSHKTDSSRVTAAQEDDDDSNNKKKKTGLHTMFRLPFESKPNPSQGSEYKHNNATSTYHRKETEERSHSQSQARAQTQGKRQSHRSNSQPQTPQEKERQQQQESQPQQQNGKDKHVLTAISELPELQKQEETASASSSSSPACRRQRGSSVSQAGDQYTHSSGEAWQLSLVANLVRAKHERLDATQGTILRHARHITSLERAETWVRVHRLRATQRRAREREARRRREEEKRRAAEEAERRRKQEEAVRAVRRLLALREEARTRRGYDWGLLAAMSYDGEVPR